MWGYENIPWIRAATRSGVTVRRVKKPAEPVKVPDEKAELWRYMDLAKLLALLQNKSLFFCRIDKLGDQFEGQWSEPTLAMLRKREHLWVVNEPDQALIEDRRTGDRLAFPKEDTNCSAEQTIKCWEHRIRRPESALKCTYVNCWYGEKEESAAMWKLHAGEKYGIAIQTNAGKLLGSFKEHLPDYFGKVEYISYDKCTIPIAALPPVFYKRSAFSHEQEVRAILAPTQREPEETEQESTGAGVNYQVDPDYLIEEIIVSPYSPAWLHDVIQGIVNNLNLDIEVRKSVMAREPSGSRNYLSVNNPRVYFACLLSEGSTPSSYIRIWGTSRHHAFVIAREEWGLGEQDTSRLEVWTEEEYLADHGCLPKHYKRVLNRFNSSQQNAQDPDPDIPQGSNGDRREESQ